MGRGALEPGRAGIARVNTAATGRVLGSGFRPAPGLGNPHVQTLAGGLLPARMPPVNRERWELPDGDFVDIDWLEPAAPRGWALVLPGLAGNLRSPYAARIVRRLGAAGYRTGLLNYRGLSGVPNRKAAAYHAGFTQDLDLVARHLNARHGSGVVLGYSMGGNLLLKWLGESGDAAPVCAAAAISAPFRLAQSSDNLCLGPARFYGRYLTGQMLSRVRRKFRLTPPAQMPALEKVRSLRDFDEHVTAPLHGFAGAQDYYDRNSCIGVLSRIAVPTLILNAVDDPLIPPTSLPEAAGLSPAVTLELSERGGHIGFLARGPRGWPRFWLEDRLLDFLDSVTPAA